MRPEPVCQCGMQYLRYNHQHDAYYCYNCKTWASEKCGNPDCRACTTRPEKAP